MPAHLVKGSGKPGDFSGALQDHPVVEIAFGDDPGPVLQLFERTHDNAVEVVKGQKHGADEYHHEGEDDLKSPVLNRKDRLIACLDEQPSVVDHSLGLCQELGCQSFLRFAVELLSLPRSMAVQRSIYEDKIEDGCEAGIRLCQPAQKEFLLLAPQGRLADQQGQGIAPVPPLSLRAFLLTPRYEGAGQHVKLARALDDPVGNETLPRGVFDFPRHKNEGGDHCHCEDNEHRRAYLQPGLDAHRLLSRLTGHRFYPVV